MQQYMDIHIKRLDEKIDKILEEVRSFKGELTDKFVEVRTEQRACKARCESHTETFNERICGLERSQIQNDTARRILEGIDEREIKRESLSTDKKIWFWIKLGAYIAALSILSDLVKYGLDKYFSTIGGAKSAIFSLLL